ncbi:hypothetical protein VE03_10258 [Pseudogymnoascus sp. 23342-1-I1]|nr:hypothetical protein VE03_10258 [Pseudogymnoascus sp. 23342-1-I1]
MPYAGTTDHTLGNRLGSGEAPDLVSPRRDDEKLVGLMAAVNCMLHRCEENHAAYESQPSLLAPEHQAPDLLPKALRSGESGERKDYEDDEDDEESEEGEESEEDEEGMEDKAVGDEQEQEEFRGTGREDLSESPSSPASRLLELLFELSMTFSTAQFVHAQPSSSLLVYFSGVLGFSSDGQNFLSATKYTPCLSGLIYVQRLLFLEYALPLRAYPYLGVPRRSRLQQYERLDVIRLRYMITGSQSPLEEFQSLRGFRRVVARADVPAFLLRWSDDGETVFYGDKFHLTMQKFRCLAEYFTVTAEKLSVELMYDLDPVVNLANVKGDLGNTQSGFSFVKHPENGLVDAYLDLSTKACLEEMLLVGLHTSGGQAPRAPALLDLEIQNGPSTKRGIYVWNGFVVYLTRHHKAKRSNNSEFYVVRFLPARLGHIMYKYLVYIRPFLSMLQRQRDSYFKEVVPTRLLATTEVWGLPANSQLYRQLTIGITEKHVQEVHKPFNRFDDVGARANRNVAFAWQSGHRPLQRATTYGLDGTFPARLQPALLRLYEWVSVQWHEFLHQPSCRVEVQAKQTAPAPAVAPTFPRQQNSQGSISTANLVPDPLRDADNAAHQGDKHSSFPFWARHNGRIEAKIDKTRRVLGVFNQGDLTKGEQKVFDSLQEWLEEWRDCCVVCHFQLLVPKCPHRILDCDSALGAPEEVPDQHWIMSTWEETEANRVANEAAYKLREDERLREMARNQQNGRDECDLVDRVEKWHAQCPICHTFKSMGHEVNADHLLEECRHPKQAIVAKETAVLKGLNLARSTGCPKCALPLYDCFNCAYSGVIHGAIAGMIIVGPTVVFNKMTAWMMTEGIRVEAKGKELSVQEKGDLQVFMLGFLSESVGAMVALVF